MRKTILTLIAGAAMMLAGFMTLTADATPLSGPAGQSPNYSPVEKVGCGGYGKCPYGQHWVCGAYGRCWCAPCGGGGYYYKPRYRYNY